jgi:hypothetical protein
MTGIMSRPFRRASAAAVTPRRARWASERALRASILGYCTSTAKQRSLTASNVPHTVVAPTYFYDNAFYDNALGGYRDVLNGMLELPLPASHLRGNSTAQVWARLSNSCCAIRRRTQSAGSSWPATRRNPRRSPQPCRMPTALASAASRRPCLPCATTARTWLPCGRPLRRRL